jgi:hypothetical protein
LVLRALSYLMTVVIHRLHETDPAWWRELLEEIKTERKSDCAWFSRLCPRCNRDWRGIWSD